MSEVEKMYENAGVEPYRYCHNCKDDNGKRIENSINCPSRKSCVNTFDTPEDDFTAEKQLSLIKWLLDNKNIGFLKFEVINGKYEVYDTYYECDKYRESLDEALADYICCLWQDLTDQERTQIAEILRG